MNAELTADIADFPMDMQADLLGHTYDSTERDSTKLSFNTQYYHNYIVALNSDNEPCLFR